MNKTKRKYFTSIAAMRCMAIIAVLAVIGFGFIGCEERISETNEVYVDHDGLRFYPIEGGKAYSVTGLPASKNDPSLINFDVPESIRGLPVTAIRENAFNGFTHLERITIADSITAIGNYAFKDCNRLENITIPDSVESMGIHVFSGCSELDTVEIGSSVTSIGNETFYQCTRLRDITIGSSVITIGDRAFYQCTNLENITIPDSVTTIGVSAFYSCTKLEDIIIPNSITTIGNNAFRLCTSFESITIPGSVTTMGSHVFSACNNLKTINVPFAENNKPTGWSLAWSGLNDSSSAEILYSLGYTAAANDDTDTTEITLTFSEAVTGLTASNITITPAGSVTIDSVTAGTGTVWIIGITVITAGDVTITINKAGIESIGKTVTVATSAPPPSPIDYEVTVDSETDTTEITLAFVSAVAGLIDSDITITPAGSVTIDSVTEGTGNAWIIGITVNTPGEVTISIDKTGIVSGNKTATIGKT